MRVLLDVNVALDVLAAREPHADAAEAVMGMAERGEITAMVAAHTVTTLHYLLVRHLGRTKSRRVLTDLLRVVGVVPVDEERLRHALALNWNDFEDAVQAACAEAMEADYLVTRDKVGFRRSGVRVLTPAELVALVS